MKIAAFADCHIGSYGKKIDEETGLNSRFLDTVGSLRFVMDDARERNVDGVLFAGDMFRHAKPTPTELMYAARALRSNFAGVLMIPGNHDLPRSAGEHSAIDPLEGTAGYGIAVSSRPNVMACAGYQVASLPYPSRAQLAAVLPDYDKLSPDEADQLISAHVESILRGLAEQLDTSRPSILLAHISIDVAEAGAERGIMAGRDITIPLSAIPTAFTFTVLGHIHKAQDFGGYDRPNVFYCGSTERIDFGEEGEGKSYVVMDLDGGTWERVPIPCRRYRTVTVDLADDWDDFKPEEVRDAICRLCIRRPEHVRPDYAKHQADMIDAGCWDFRGFVEDVQRVAAVRSEEIVQAQSLEELLGVWHAAKGCDAALGDLVAAGQELERTIG